MATCTERLREMVAESFDVEPQTITDQTRFAEDLQADSLDAVELAMDVEEEFDIDIPDDVIERLATFGQAVAYLKERLER